MRDEIIAYLQANIVDGFDVTEELPWSTLNEPLYVKKMTRLFVDESDVEQDPLFDTLDGGSFVNEITTTNVYVTNDAKKKPANYDALVTMVKAVSSTDSLDGLTARVTDVDIEYIEDAMTTTFIISLERLIRHT